MAKSTVITGVHRLHFIFSFVIAGLFLTLGAEASAQATCMDNTSGPFGSLLSVDEFDSAVQALPAAALLTPPVQPPLPSRAYLTNLPAVSQQGTAASPGSPGTCEAQSFGYGLGSYTAATPARRLVQMACRAAAEFGEPCLSLRLGARQRTGELSAGRFGATLSRPTGGSKPCGGSKFKSSR